MKIYDISSYQVVHTLDYPNAVLSLDVSVSNHFLLIIVKMYCCVVELLLQAHKISAFGSQCFIRWQQVLVQL